MTNAEEALRYYQDREKQEEPQPRITPEAARDIWRSELDYAKSAPVYVGIGDFYKKLQQIDFLVYGVRKDVVGLFLSEAGCQRTEESKKIDGVTPSKVCKLCADHLREARAGRLAQVTASGIWKTALSHQYDTRDFNLCALLSLIAELRGRVKDGKPLLVDDGFRITAKQAMEIWDVGSRSTSDAHDLISLAVSLNELVGDSAPLEFVKKGLLS